MEIITWVERRRRWRVEDRLRIVAEVETPGAIIFHVARRHHISRGLLSNRRQQFRRGALAADHHSAVFMPVRMLSEPMSSSPAVAVPREQNGVAGMVADDRRIEIARAPTFLEKARLFPGTTFVVSADTEERLFGLKYYGDDEARMHDALEELAMPGAPFWWPRALTRRGAYAH